MNILKVRSCKLNVKDLILKRKDTDVRYINDLVLDIDESEVKKLAIRLANQFI
jgi:hypothetical protein